VGTDCGPEANAATYDCTSNKCAVATCKPGCYDVNKTYSDGCECCGSTNNTCATAKDLGAASIGAKQTVTGQIPDPMGGDWYSVTFNNESNIAFHALITFTTNPTNDYVFDVVGGSCGGSALNCATEGGSSIGRTTWEVSYSGPNPPGDPTSVTPSGASNFTAIGAVGKVYIHVYRANTSGPPTCDQYTLQVGE
jgi:hypothetical protein